MKLEFNNAIEKLSSDPMMDDFRFGYYFLPQDQFVVMTVESTLVRNVKRKFRISMKRLHAGVHSPEVRIYDQYLKMVDQFKSRYPHVFNKMADEIVSVVRRAKEMVTNRLILSAKYLPGGEGSMSGVEVKKLDGSLHFVTSNAELKNLMYKELYNGGVFVGDAKIADLSVKSETVQKTYSLEGRAIPRELTRYVDNNFERGSGTLSYAKGWYWRLRDQGASSQTAISIVEQKLSNRKIGGLLQVTIEDLNKMNEPWEKPVNKSLVDFDTGDVEKRIAAAQQNYNGAQDFHERVQAQSRMVRKGHKVTPKDFIISDDIIEDTLKKKRDALHEWQKKLIDSIRDQIHDEVIFGRSLHTIVLDEAPRPKKPLTEKEQQLVNAMQITENQNVHSHRLGYMNKGMYDKDYKDE